MQPRQVRDSVSPSTAISVGTSNFGGFGATFGHCLTLPPTSYSGRAFDFAFAAGDHLKGSYSGFFSPTATPGLLNTTVDYVATGGTGRFLGASGAFRGVGTLDRRLPRPLNRLAFAGKLDLPAVPEPTTWAMMILGLGMAGTALRLRRLAIGL